MTRPTSEIIQALRSRCDSRLVDPDKLSEEAASRLEALEQELNASTEYAHNLEMANRDFREALSLAHNELADGYFYTSFERVKRLFDMIGEALSKHNGEGK